MRTFTGIAALTVGWLAVEAGTASAAWNNVFQTCCQSCSPAPRSSFFAPAPSACCPPTVAYQQRCYYQPYTAYRQESYYEPVTTYRTSYYWEPVTSYRYTSYYDPCTGCSQQVATPCTSYQLRSQCNACQSYVQRCRAVPYTAYRQSCYMEPVVSCAPACPTCPTCPTGGCPTGGCPTAGTPAPAVSEPPPQDRKPLPAPGVSEDKDFIPKQQIPPTNRQVTPRTDSPLRMDRIASNTNGRLQGTVVSDDRITPKAGARIIFANAGKQLTAQAGPDGRFAIELPAGDWDIYMSDRDGKPVYHSQLSVNRNDQRLVTVVSR
jgi:hypothetical protein